MIALAITLMEKSQMGVIFLHGRIEIYTGQDDDPKSETFVRIGARAMGTTKYIDYDFWKNEWICKSKDELAGTLQRILKVLEGAKSQ